MSSDSTIRAATVTRSEGDIPSTLNRALLAYALVLITASAIMFWMARTTIWASLVIGLLVAQITLNVLFLPVYLDFWAEFSSQVAIYSLIQVGTPIVIALYAFTKAWTDIQKPPANVSG